MSIASELITSEQLFELSDLGKLRELSDLINTRDLSDLRKLSELSELIDMSGFVHYLPVSGASKLIIAEQCFEMSVLVDYPLAERVDNSEGFLAN